MPAPDSKICVFACYYADSTGYSSCIDCVGPTRQIVQYERFHSHKTINFTEYKHRQCALCKTPLLELSRPDACTICIRQRQWDEEGAREREQAAAVEN